jgi:hypothetical protein
MTQASCDLREYFLLGYAGILLNHPNLWQIGLKYLSYCPVYGPSFLEYYLSHIPFDNYVKLRKLLQAAQDYNCPNAFKLLNRIVAQRKIKTRRYGSAISYMIDGEMNYLIGPICHKIIEHYASTG